MNSEEQARKQMTQHRSQGKRQDLSLSSGEDREGSKSGSATEEQAREQLTQQHQQGKHWQAALRKQVEAEEGWLL
jgi:hypothetical protein